MCALVLTQAQAVTFKELAGSRTAPKREVERAKVRLGHAAGNTITEPQRQLGVGRPMIDMYIAKAQSVGESTYMCNNGFNIPPMMVQTV